MTHFYQALRSAPTKAEALRQAQLSLLRRATTDPGANQSGLREHLADHPVLAAHPEPIDLPLSHPYYWASFMTIGSPW
jgi:CHAT domain-containing protein